MKPAIQVTGTQPFMGKEIPVVLGGFGMAARCICDKTAAEIHEMREPDIRRRIADNIERFTEAVDYIDLAQRVRQPHTLEILLSLGYSKQSIKQAEHIYILSERGYFKLVKILNSDQAWDVYEKLLSDYFSMREERKQKTTGGRQASQKLPPLSSFNTAIRLTVEAMRAAGVAEEYIVETMRNSYRPYGISIPEDCVTVQEHFMSQTEIARRLGVMTRASGGKTPSAAAIGGILTEIPVTDREVKNAPFSKNGHSGDSKLYAESVVERVSAWLLDNGFPPCIRGRDGKNQRVVYKEVSA